MLVPPQDSHHQLLHSCGCQVCAENMGLMWVRVKGEPCTRSSISTSTQLCVRVSPRLSTPFSQTGCRHILVAEQHLGRIWQQWGLCVAFCTNMTVVATCHFTCTKCFMPVLKVVAQVLRHLFYICCAYECKHWSLKVIFTNVFTFSEFTVLMYHQGDPSNAIMFQGK